MHSSFEEFFGRKREQITDKSVYELSPKEFDDLYYEKDLSLLQNPGIQIYESVVKDRGGVAHDVIFHKATFPNMDGSVGGLIGAILDITDRKQVVARIKKALGATIQAIAVTVEARDPYTAGHQRRVADLARAIATEMNLSADQIDGIRMAAAIHDLGKISVPTEILSRPTKLTNIEFNPIKTHSQSGYDILKDIDFPWPVARTVLEHHERMNGSGYPNGLTGDNILLESRILAVADVVESIASHRSYRSALGIDVALNEISKNKGVLYDPEVSDACLRLFHEKDYQIID
jgi:PAS domain S-box-containing protein